MNNIWFTSDNHYYHKRILEFCRNTRRGETMEEMNELMIESHNSIVKPRDTVWFLGDISFGKEEETLQVLRRLNGIKNLVFGNHCHEIRKSTILKSEFNSTQDIKVLKQGKSFRAVLSHYPHAEWFNCHHGYYHLFGHQHGSYNNVDKRFRCMDVGIDARGDNLMLPWSLEEIVDKLKDKEILSHHGEAHERTR